MAPLSRFGQSKVGRVDAPKPGRTYQLQTGHRGPREASVRVAGTLFGMPRSLRAGLMVAAIAATFLTLVGCSRAAATSFDPSSACTTDGRMAGAYPDLEALVPKSYRGEAPQTVDSGRNCTAGNLGSLASAGISEVRFAGATWTFGGERALVLAIFKAKGLDADAMAAFYGKSAAAASRTQITAQSNPKIGGRPGPPPHTPTSGRTPTPAAWPAADTNGVNLVLSNHPPHPRTPDPIPA